MPAYAGLPPVMSHSCYDVAYGLLNVTAGSPLQDLEVEIFLHMLARESEATTGIQPYKAGTPVNSFAAEGDGMARASTAR